MQSIGAVAFAQTTGQNPTGSSGQAGSSTMTQGRQSGDRGQGEQQITLVGCIQRESDYRQMAGGGRGGTMGTGIGVGNEFVLTNASMGSSKSQTATTGTGTSTGTMTSGSGTSTGSTTGSATGSSTGTTGSATGSTTGSATGTTSGTTGSSTRMSASGTAYALTGAREGDLEKYVGQRVEIVGTLEDGAAGMGTGSASGTTDTTSGTTTSGTGTTSGTTTSGTGTMTGGAAGTKSVDDLKEVDVMSVRAVGGSCAQQ